MCTKSCNKSVVKWVLIVIIIVIICPVICIFFFYLFSSPNLTGRRLELLNWSIVVVVVIETSGHRILMRGLIAQLGIFHWENVMWLSTAFVAGQLECWITACREIPTSGPLGMVLGYMWENPDVISPQKCGFHRVCGPYLIHSSLVPTRVHITNGILISSAN